MTTISWHGLPARVEKATGKMPVPRRAGFDRTVPALSLILLTAACQVQAADDSVAPLPPRALVRIGTDDLRTHGFIMAVAFSPDGRLIAAVTSHALVGVELATGRTRWSNPPEKVTTMQFEAHSPWFQAALRDGTVILFNALTGHEQRRFLADWRTPEQRKAEQPSYPLMRWGSFSADGRTLVSSTMGWIYVWDVESGTMRRKFRHPHEHGCILTLAPDGRTRATSDLLYSDDPGEDTIRLYDVESGAEVLTLQPRDDRAHVLAFSPDGTRLFTGSGRGTGIIWDVRREGDAAGKTR